MNLWGEVIHAYGEVCLEELYSQIWRKNFYWENSRSNRTQDTLIQWRSSSNKKNNTSGNLFLIRHGEGDKSKLTLEILFSDMDNYITKIQLQNWVEYLRYMKRFEKKNSGFSAVERSSSKFESASIRRN